MSQLFRKKSVAQILEQDASHTSGLKRVLGVRDLTFLGVAAIVGAGIFATIGKASFDAGPAIVLLFIIVGLACTLTAWCYAEFASIVPVSGSAYTYAYVAFGEIIAWMIGWDLLMEYAIGNIAVAISWSDYFSSLMSAIHLPIPAWLCTDYASAKAGINEEAIKAWATAPQIGSWKIICDLPAFLITALITAIIYRGIKESKASTNLMVLLKLAIIVMVIVVGAFYVDTGNWTPFMPNGWDGVFAGTAAVFFSYIGFDAISTTAEEAKNPQRDLPKAMFNSLVICTVLYILIAIVLTGMVGYQSLNVGDPLAFVFKAVGQTSLSGVIAVSTIIATASVLLVFQLGQPRIWMSMSRDGLLPPIFSRIHPRYKTPSFSTLLTGVVVGIPALFLDLNFVIDLTSVGTLFAFVLVCGGILRLDWLRRNNDEQMRQLPKSKFRVPYISAQYWLPFLFIATLYIMEWLLPNGIKGFILGKDYQTWYDMYHRVPYVLFLILFAGMAVLAFKYKLSLIPSLGLLSCGYLLCESGETNWDRFLIWLLIGLVIYVFYGRRKSKLRNQRSLNA